MERNSAQGQRNEIWWKAPFLSNVCDCLRKNGTCCDWQVFFFTSDRLEDFSSPETITDSPFKPAKVIPHHNESEY